MTKALEVLLLDDEPIVGKRLGPAIAKMGCETESFTDPRAALARLEEGLFDIIVTDIRMDDIDGIQVLEHVRKKSQRTKVIMITGYAMMALAREAMSTRQKVRYITGFGDGILDFLERCRGNLVGLINRSRYGYR